MTKQELNIRIFIQRVNDVIYGRNQMNYQRFCEAIDELIPSDKMNMNSNGVLLSTRESYKQMAGLMQTGLGRSYYELYLSIKFNTPL